MLHRILHHPFSLSSSPLSPHLLSCSSPRRLQGMEFVEGGFGGGFGPKTPGKAVVLNMDDGGGGAAGGDDFFVDELLDFSNGYSETEEHPVELPENEMDGKKISPFSPEKQEAAPPPPPENGALSPELSVQAAEGLESLEWLSHFVEESFSDYPLTGKFPHNPTAARSEPPQAAAKEQPCFTTPVQTKARTKRARTGVRVWPVLSPSFAETSAASSSSSSSSTSFSPPALYFVQTETGDSSLRKPPAAKKRKSKPADVSGGGGAVQQQPRRCSHCGVTKTPQWRAGPLGPKTLCNACGVRFKSGRLLPEYRPASSPTFSTDLHSNSHRKVLEMRRKKELEN
ncbi:hypothetical protein ACP275_08G254400 [Erythranthe tilingii]